MRTLLTILVISLLSACEDTPQMNVESIDVSSYQALEKYWLLPDDAQPKPGRVVMGELGCREITSKLTTESDKPTAFIDIEFLIDSNGKRFGEYIRDHSDDAFTKELVNFVKHTDEQLAPFSAYDFTAKVSNTELTPVFVTETLAIESGTDTCKA